MPIGIMLSSLFVTDVTTGVLDNANERKYYQILSQLSVKKFQIVFIKLSWLDVNFLTQPTSRG